MLSYTQRFCLVLFPATCLTLLICFVCQAKNGRRETRSVVPQPAAIPRPAESPIVHNPPPQYHMPLNSSHQERLEIQSGIRRRR